MNILHKRKTFQSMKKIIVLSVFVIINCSSLLSQSYSSNGYYVDSLKVDSITMGYGLLEPINKEPNKKYPLILALHGMEWTSIYNSVFDIVEPNDLLEFYIATNLAKQSFREKYPAYVLVPRHVVDEQIHHGEERVWYRQGNLVVLDSIISYLYANENIDTNRLYVTGHSVGGDGSFNMPFKLRHKVAAIAPMAAATVSQDTIMKNLEKGLYNRTPIWCFDHYRDDYNPIDRREFFTKLDSLGQSTVYTHAFGDEGFFLGKPEIQEKINNRHRYFYTEYHKNPKLLPHYIMQFASADTLFYNWLFQKYLIDEEAISITDKDCEGHDVCWLSKNRQDSVEVWFREDKDWQLIVKGVFAENQVLLNNYTGNSKQLTGTVRVACINKEGFMYGFDEKKVSGLYTGNNKIPNKPNFTAYPNPFNNFIRVNASENIKYSLYNVNGILLRQGYGNKIDTEGLLRGMYFLHIDKDNKNFMIKLVK